LQRISVKQRGEEKKLGLATVIEQDRDKCPEKKPGIEDKNQYKNERDEGSKHIPLRRQNSGL